MFVNRFGVGGDGIFGGLVRSRSRVVEEVFGGNMMGEIVFVDT